MGDARITTMPLVQQVVQRRLSHASDQSLLEFSRLMIDQLSSVRTRDPLLCYMYAMGEDP